MILSGLLFFVLIAAIVFALSQANDGDWPQ